MIKLKLHTIESGSSTEIPIVIDETIREAVTRVLENVPLPPNKKSDEVFQVLHNGHFIGAEMWGLIRLKSDDTLLVAPLLQDGDTAKSLARVVLIVGLTAVATTLLGPGAGLLASGSFAGFAGANLTGFAFYAAAAGASLLISMAVNALIPPPDFSNHTEQGPESSQMYAITGQGNSVSRLRTVPKVYGTHRMFPNVAANPYTEIEMSPGRLVYNTNINGTYEPGQLVQYLYAIYDFGLGPAVLSNLKIGETPLSEYSDYQYNLVDLNKPAVNEGDWDTPLKSNFEYYKGDASSENIAVDLNQNLTTVPQPSSIYYTATRLTPENLDDSPQTITLTFVNQQGLYCYSASGAVGKQWIELEIDFQRVGESTWHAWNDINYTNDSYGVGGDPEYTDVPIPIVPFPTNPVTGARTYIAQQNGWVTLLSISGTIQSTITPAEVAEYGLALWPAEATAYLTKNYTYGVRAGENRVVMRGDNGPNYPAVGDYLGYNSTTLGQVISKTGLTGDFDGYVIYTLDRPILFDIPLYVINQGGFNAFIPPVLNLGLKQVYRYIDVGVNNKIFWRKGSMKKAIISRAEVAVVYSTFRFTPKNPGQYRVRVTRVKSYGIYSSQVTDGLTWANITTRFDRAPIVTDKRHLFMEVRIRATNQLNGAIANLSGEVSGVVDVFNGTNWVKQVSSNPAWVFADLMTGEVNKRAIDKSRLDTDSLLEWAAFCDQVPTAPPDVFNLPFYAPRFESNFILDYAATLQQVLQTVTSAAQASLSIIDGKYGVLIDRRRTTPVQVFTPRNSSGFSSNRVYSTRPDSLKIQYVDPSGDWELGSITVYEDGFTVDNAVTFEEITAFGATNWEQAWRYGRYLLAANRLRQENISIKVDFEYLVCTRGDYVQITQDIMKVGGSPARVISVVGNRIRIDDGIEIGALSYGYVFRADNGQIKTSTLTPVTSDTFDLDGDLPVKGNLIVIGEVGKVVFDCIVKSITPDDDLTATLVLVEKADPIYDAESTSVLPGYSPQLNQTTDADFAPPGPVLDLVVADNFWACADRGYEYYVDLDWDAPAGSAYEAFEVYVNSGQGFNLAGTTRNSLFHYVVDSTRLGFEHEFKVVAVSATGKKLDLGSVTGVLTTPIVKITPPSDVEFLATDITNQILQLSWTQINDCDAREYLIRYSPVQNATWSSSIPLLRVDRNTTLANVQARTGSYLIKAVDFNFNESANVAYAFTTIPSLFGLNIISEITDFPDLLGSFDRAVNTTGALVLAESISGSPDVTEYYSEGFYYYQNLLDLGDIYTVRLQSRIVAEGFTAEDVMSNWTTLSDVTLLANARTSEWDVETQYRSTDELNVMADWASLSDIDVIGGGSDDDFTPWRKFVMGDATGRVFQFRIRLISNKVSVSPRVFDGTIQADMPDRIDRYTNLTIPVEGYTLVYQPAFKGPSPSPNIQYSIDGAESGDHPVFTARTVEGFTVQILDADDNPVERQVDFQVAGYGSRSNATI